MEGRILGNRYELIEKVGGGGMAIVYKAKCKLLNRFVAVKILRPEFTNDEEFVKRFRVEAQSAASLSHPNIVSIYDVGNDQNIHYIIMEFVDGITLKEYIDSKDYLPWREAVSIAIQICSAIENAHRNHIVHRDIKPHNILLTKDGVAKVTDFGIARAVSSSTITMVGSTIGSVHYFSPEQARGGFIDEKSDLYSLGITLFEMVTGKLPFDGETPIAVALKHIQVEAKAPIEINTNIPNCVNNIIMKTIKKDQNKRYQSALELLNDLNLALKDPLGSFVVEDRSDESPTRRIKAILEENTRKRDEYLLEGEEPIKKVKKGDKITKWLGVITTIVLLISLSIWIGLKIVSPILDSDNKEFTMGNYVGRNIDEVKSILKDAGFLDKDITVTEDYNDEYLVDVICSQNIDEGKSLKVGGYSTIQFTVSKGVELIKVPDVTNKESRIAGEIVRTAGLNPDFLNENNNTVPKGSVIRTEPAKDEQLKRNDSIKVYISLGPEILKTLVPNLLGLTQSEARDKIIGAKLAVGNTFPQDGTNLEAKVISQNPIAGSEVDENTPVDIYLEVSDSQIHNASIIVELANPGQYREKINVQVKRILPGTANEEIVMDMMKAKTEFPYTVPVSGPSATKIRVYFDGKFINEYLIP